MTWLHYSVQLTGNAIRPTGGRPERGKTLGDSEHQTGLMSIAGGADRAMKYGGLPQPMAFAPDRTVGTSPQTGVPGPAAACARLADSHKMARAPRV